MADNSSRSVDSNVVHLTGELISEIADFLGIDGVVPCRGIKAASLGAVLNHPEFWPCLSMVQRSHGLVSSSRSVVPLQEIESEYEEKATKIRCSSLEYSDLFISEFLELIFERRLRSFSVDVPFEDIRSFEYGEWCRQKSLLPDGEAVDYSLYRMWRYNPVIFFKEGKKARHRLLLKDDDETLAFLENRQFAIMSPMTYVGRTNTYENARFLYALAFDVDGIGLKELGWLLHGMNNGRLPLANIIVNSGHGVHLYYVLEQPVPMYKRNIEIMNKLKRMLTDILWTVSADDNKQYQGINQGFRLPGTLTKFGKPISAFWCRQAPTYTPASLNDYLSNDDRLSKEDLSVFDNPHPYDPTKVTKEEAKRRWPEWYAARVLGKQRIVKKWKLNKGLYYWWLNILKDGKKVTVHHRYWCVLTLVVYAVKCDIPKSKVRTDAYSLLPYLDSLTDSEDNHFTKDDVEDTLKAYDEGYNKWPVDTIESTTAIRIDRNKRNGRRREAHIKIMNFIRDNVAIPDGTWREGNGRKKGSRVLAPQSPQFALVSDWIRNHPGNSNKSLCARDTGLSRPTVHKWWQIAFAKDGVN